MNRSDSVICVKILKALADETRWRLMKMLLRKSFTVNELSHHLQLTPYNTSKHLRILREAGIIQPARNGKNVIYSITPEFRRQVAQGRKELNFGCCTFRFDHKSA